MRKSRREVTWELGRNLEPRIARMPRVGLTEKEVPRRNGLDLAASARRGGPPMIEHSIQRSIRKQAAKAGSAKAGDSYFCFSSQSF
jgi:hypothetical protein